MSEFVTIGELLALAEKEIPSPAIHFVLSGAGSEETYRRNRQALEQLAIEQRILIGLDEVDISTRFLDIDLPSPVIAAPMGSMFHLHPDGDLEMIRGVTRDGSMSTVPRMAGWPLEEVAAQATGPLLFQMYCEANDPGKQREEIERVQACPEYRGIVLTIDGPIKDRLDRYVETRVVQDRSRFPGPRSPGHRFNWADMDRIRNDVQLPMGLKGVMCAEDARAALDHGADFVWVSNHGGRHLDSARATIDVLDDVVEVVEGRVPIVIDSGFRRGSDVLKGLAKGATLVAFGKVAACALGVGGADGVAQLLQLVQGELKISLAMSGGTNLRKLSRDMVRKISY